MYSQKIYQNIHKSKKVKPILVSYIDGHVTNVNKQYKTERNI